MEAYCFSVTILLEVSHWWSSLYFASSASRQPECCGKLVYFLFLKGIILISVIGLQYFVVLVVVLGV